MASPTLSLYLLVIICGLSQVIADGRDENVVWVDRPNADCATLAEPQGGYIAGVYELHPAQSNPFDAYCDGAWTVIQRRVIGDVNFYRNWGWYQYGFGEMDEMGMSDYWLGLERIYYLTNQRRYRLQITMEQADGSVVYAQYEDFYIESEDENYRLHVDGYVGTAGDALNVVGDATTIPHNGSPFSTADRDNDYWEEGNCAEVATSGWWFTDCAQVNLNGIYMPYTEGDDYPTCGNSVRGCLKWQQPMGGKNIHPLRMTQMRIIPVD